SKSSPSRPRTGRHYFSKSSSATAAAASARAISNRCSRPSSGSRRGAAIWCEGPMGEKNFDAFKETIEWGFMQHPVVTSNEYTRWFADGDLSVHDVRRFTVQFSVFSNQFLLAALNRAINADTLEAARESKEILMNELGVVYNAGATSRKQGESLDT